ncbi:MAG: hypothetical protein M1838_001889 [Thelocarpon superellum]|nr:MAG: hypothetical protein M1838_001889 [Thelocarpon superellum]
MVTPPGSPSDKPASSAPAYNRTVAPSIISGGAALSAISGGGAPSAVSGGATPSITAAVNLASLGLNHSGSAALPALATAYATFNGKFVSIYGNGTALPPDAPAPNWTVLASELPMAPTIPEPSPQPASDPATGQLIRTVQDKVLRDYEAYSTFSCFQAGDTFDCSGPWLYADQWDNSSTLSNLVTQNTALDPSYYCSYDTTYLQSSDFDRTFYGFTAANLTASLQSMANYSSLWAAGACASNSSCAAAYQNDTEQMYSDFQGYIRTGFFNSMTAALQNDSLSYCPSQITGPGSLITYATSYFDGSKEYFGLHNPVFVGGVAESINGTLEEARLELGLTMANNAARAEAVFLNMIFFAPLSSTTTSKRSVDDEEVYPGCTRREYVMKGSCDGVLPPRHYDLAGRFMPMKDRDQRLNRRDLDNTRLVLRDSSCDAQQNSLVSDIQYVQTARALFSLAFDYVATAGLLPLATEVGGTVALVINAYALLEMLILSFLAECAVFNTCNGLPPAIVAIAKDIATAQAGVAAAFLYDKAGAKGLITFLRNLISEEAVGVFTAANAGALGAGVLAGGLGAIIDSLLSNAQKYYEGALGCCQANCDSSTCLQASPGCFLHFGSQWSGSGGLQCDAT